MAPGFLEKRRLEGSRFRAKKAGSPLALVGFYIRVLALCRCGQIFQPWYGLDGRPMSHARASCGPRCPARWIAAALRKYLANPLASRQCLWCLESFAPKTDRQSCCSVACRGKIENRRRKSRLRGLGSTAISLPELYRRDHGRCGLCGGRVRSTLKYPHPGAPTVDHVIPITVGGKNELLNAQLAHARCNTAKGNRKCSSQMRMFA